MELDALFIMLGKECNGNCIYCVQHDKESTASEEYYKELPKVMKNETDIINFIVEQAEYTHKALVKKNATNIYGLQINKNYTQQIENVFMVIKSLKSKGYDSNTKNTKKI